MITELGKILRKIRIDRSEVLKDMSNKLGISSAYLSAIEIGKRTIPDKFITKLQKIYTLDEGVIEELNMAVDRAAENVKIDLKGTKNIKRNAALIFARNFENMDKATAENILKLFSKEIPEDE